MQVDIATSSVASATNTIYYSVDLLLGAIFVLFYAGTRFNTPASNRSSTTAGRYFVGLVLYCLVGIASYLTLVSFPNLLDFTLYGHQMGGDAPTNKISLPLFVALLLTVLLPKIPLLSSADKWVCTQLQNMAAIPWEVLRLSNELQKFKLQFSAEEQAAVQEMLEADGFDRKDIIFELTDTVSSDWTRVTALLQKVEDWRSDRRMAGYLVASSSDLEKLHHRHQALSAKAKTCFYLRSEDGRGGTTRKTHQAMLRYEEDFMEHIKQLRKDILDFIARGVLRSELTNRALESRLNSMGFRIDWPESPFSLNQLLLIFAVVCSVMLPGFIFFGNNSLSFEALLIRLGLIGFTYVLAVACAILPKSSLSFAQAKAGEMRPIAFYLVAGLMSAAISFLITLMVQAIWMHSVQWALQRSRFTYPWLLVSFATAFITAMMADNPRFPRVSCRVQRCLEGLAQAALMLGVTYLTCLWLDQRVEVYKNVDLSYLKYRAPQPVITVVMGAVVGFVIGFLIPTWYRRYQEQAARERTGNLALVTSVPAPSTQTMISIENAPARHRQRDSGRADGYSQAVS
jgi:hypothetical protein